jgi:hypothetical protein
VATEVVFLGLIVVAVIVLPATAGGLAALIGHFAGLRRPAVLALAGSTAAATAAAVIGVASIASAVLFS